MQKVTHYHEETDTKVKDVLERLRTQSPKQKIRIHLGDKDTGRVWLEEYDVIGYIGRSTGVKPCALLIPSLKADGGGSILTHCILRIQDTKTGRNLYQHENYKKPDLKIAKVSDDLKAKGYKTAVERDGEMQANFKSLEKALDYIAFMQGERMKV